MALPPLTPAEDQPQSPVPHRLRCIACGRHRFPARMRMIMPDQHNPSSPRAPIRSKQRSRLDLERPRRLGGHIRAGLGSVDAPFRPEQQPAHLAIGGIFCVG